MRTIPLSHRSHIVGSTPVGGATIAHESALERDFVTLVRWRDAGAGITSQPVTIGFEIDGETRRYTPDFLVAWSNGASDLVEIKYRADLRMMWRRLRPSFEAARTWARARGARFAIVTEGSIRTPELALAARLLPLRDAPIDAMLAREALALAGELGRPTFAELATAMPAARAAATGVIWRLIARGALVITTDVPPGPLSAVWRP